MSPSFHALFSLCTLIVVASSSSLSLNPSATHLLQFLYSLPKQSQELLPWNLSTPPCNWPGVSCYPQKDNTTFQLKALNLTGYGLSGVLHKPVSYLCRHESLLSLDLSGNKFTGGIPPILSDCSRLNTLLLNDNGLTGKIPPGLFQSKRFSRIDLGYNSLSGKIPAEVNLSVNLEYLGLYNNFLSGKIPAEIFSLPKLKFLYLNTNNLTGELPDFPSPCPILELWIHENKLSGTIQPKIFNGVEQLQVLYLNGNNLEGEIPETLWSLRNLQELVLSENRLNGTLSERIGECNQLSIVALSENNLVGQIPKSIGNLTYLYELLLFNNMLTGSLPSELGNCSSLVQLRLQHNFIRGKIPREFSKLRNLEILHLFNNGIEGNVPKEIGNISNLVELALYDNSLSGTLPDEITHLRKLTFLSLAHNNLTGKLPEMLGKSSSGLVKLDLSGNRFHGAIPSSLCTYNNLSVLALANNRFNESFPVEIGKCSSLKRVILSYNLLNGNISDTMNKNSGIIYMDVRGNLLEGKIPNLLGYWNNLSMLDLSENRLWGSIPPEFGNLKNLQVLRLSSNKLTGSIPASLSGCKQIIELDLSKNSLSGSLPAEMTSLEKLQSLLLEENELNGSIPDSFSALGNLIKLQLGSNMLQGPIPCSISNLHHFSSLLNLSHNRLSGEIPGCLGKLDKLQILDLSSNRLSGEIPVELNNMISLSFVNISFNHLVGNLPSKWTQMVASNQECFIGNPGLCLSGYCEEARKGHNRSQLLAGVTIGVVFFLVLCAVVYAFIVRKLREKFLQDKSPLKEYRCKVEDLPEDLRLEDIMRATEGWSDKYVIGRGKHGTVYKTQSLNSRKNWAVKKVNLSETNFRIEMRTLRFVRHRNVVRMAGYCIRDSYGFIVTEYMPGGTLFDVLHRKENRLILDWNTRYRIALGIAQGLSYLHYDCSPQIIHRDIKSNNVLLDSELEPKIADFGTAKLVHDSDASSTKSSIIGTLGYMAPETAYSTQLTAKSDVYSYGVILLEILIRKLPVDPSFEEGMDIVLWTRQKLMENEESISFLDEEISLWDSDEQYKALRLLELALSCTEPVASSRPSMRDIVGVLQKLNAKLPRDSNKFQLKK
ncbi:leucine-rich repeat receptor-like protein kinase PEPR2 isoform X2 [Carica papaya]|uniref:leucine-rich repeat receptor-like protein kinase PEPR2 isoform X2 n=1 Tax=Carica papaya TaxID=3649 RepID=UPI000B8CC3BA|nr:leucine-rich repeat receptor-like protein kinase PEPR2 isoform X2 [Carica papaya]